MTYCWGASGNVNILMFNRTLVDNANRDTSNNRSFFEYYGVIHILRDSVGIGRTLLNQPNFS